MQEPRADLLTDDFRRFREAGHYPGTSRLIGQAFCNARDAIARGLIVVGVTPNMLTFAGFAATCGAATCFFLGGSYSHAAARAAGLPAYMLVAAGLLFLAGACDMLDGAVAKLANLQTPIGAILDSTIDRMSDAVIYVALIGHFITHTNLTYGVLAAMAMTNSLLISYVKARSESVVANCTVGFWMRGERGAALLIAACAGNVPALLWQQAFSPAFTVLRRLLWVRQVLAAQANGRPEPNSEPAPGIARFIRPWRCPRGSVPYDLTVATNIAFLITAPHLHPIFGPAADPLARLVALLNG